ncbi:MAG: hypothetical protein ACFNPZ_00705 [Fusobacterium polymorphum]
MDEEEKNLKIEITNKLKEMVKNFIEKSLEETILDEYFKIAEDYVNNKPYNLENHLTMIGFAVETNKICNSIEDKNLKIKLEEKGQIIWERWYQKIHNTVDELDTVKKVKRDIEESKN